MSTRRKLSTCCKMTYEVANTGGKGCFRTIRHATKAHCVGFRFNLGVDIASSSGHVARAHRFTARGFHGFVNVARHIALGDIFTMGFCVMIAQVKGQSIRRSPRQEHFVAGHAPAHLWKAHGIARDTGGIHRIGDVKVCVLRHRFCGFCKRLFKRIRGVVR